MPRSKTTRDQQILEAATELFFEHGFSATSVAAIGERVGVTGPAIYGQFTSKEEILSTLVLEAVDRLALDGAEQLEDPHAELERLVRHQAVALLRDRKLAGVCVRESRSLPEASREVIAPRLRSHLDNLITALERCWPRQDRATLAAAATATLGLAASTVLWREDALRTANLDQLLVEMTFSALRVLDGGRLGAG